MSIIARSLLRFYLFTAYRHESLAYNAVLDYFSVKDEDTTWIIPVLVRVSNDLRTIAEKVQKQHNTSLPMSHCSFKCTGGRESERHQQQVSSRVAEHSHEGIHDCGQRPHSSPSIGIEEISYFRSDECIVQDLLPSEHAAALRQADQRGGGPRRHHGQSAALPRVRRDHVQVLHWSPEDVRGSVRGGEGVPAVRAQVLSAQLCEEQAAHSRQFSPSRGETCSV